MLTNTLLLFINCRRVMDTPHEIPALGIHALSAYLKSCGYPSKAMQLFYPSSCHEFTSLMGIISNSVDSQQQFEKNPLLYIKKHLKNSEYQALKNILTVWATLIIKEETSVLGITVYRMNLAITLLFSAFLKEMRPELFIVLGGPEIKSATLSPLLQTRYVDALVKGEGEEALSQIIQYCQSKKKITHPGVFLKKNTLNSQNFFLTQVQAINEPLDMEKLPVPDFDEISNRALLPVEFNRGCVAQCDFCEETRFWKNYRQMSVSRAVEHVAQLKQRYGTTQFHLSQSLMNGDITWLESFAHALIDADLNITWGGNARIHPKMTRDFMRLLRQSGCRFFHFGVESGSQLILKKMKKGVRVSVISEVLRNADEEGLWNHTYWIFGYPGETKDDFLETIQFIFENSHLIDSHFYHEYGDYDAIGNSHTSIYSYIHDFHKMFSVQNAFYYQHRPFVQKLFEIENLLYSEYCSDHLRSLPTFNIKTSLSNLQYKKYSLDLRRLTMALILYCFEYHKGRELLNESFSIEEYRHLLRKLSLAEQLKSINEFHVFLNKHLH